MNIRQSGFTLIELMVVVAIIGILASIAIPAYQDYLIRSRINEGIMLSAAPKSLIATDATTNKDLLASASIWNLTASGKGATTKYVSSLLINNNGEIIVTFNSTNIGPISSNSTLVLTPYIQTGTGLPVELSVALAGAGVTGTIDWGCASASNAIGISRNLPALTSGTLIPKYAPGECR